MATWTTTRSCAGDVAELFARVVDHLGRSGYTTRERSAGHARLAFDGSPLAGAFAKLDHTLTVAAVGQELTFKLTSGWALSVDDDDALELAARVDGAIRAAGGRPGVDAPPAGAAGAQALVVERQVLVARCKYCGEITPVDLEACARCGATKLV